jgi:hypothetical protein
MRSRYRTLTGNNETIKADPTPQTFIVFRSSLANTYQRNKKPTAIFYHAAKTEGYTPRIVVETSVVVIAETSSASKQHSDSKR